MKLWKWLLLCLVVMNASLGVAQDALLGLDPIYVDFIKAEMGNSYQAQDSTVDERYRGKTLEPFRVGYLEIPANSLNLEFSQANDRLLKDHFFVNGKRDGMIRFYIHPDSEHLYKPLIQKYGYKGFYLALPTASTRSVLAWDPQRPDVKPVFLKLSLAQIQDQLGRIIPGWEVRRSVRVTEMIDADRKSGRVRNLNVHIIPEVAGAYVREADGLPFFVDKEQGKVSEHGYILRDASFIEKNRGKKVVPMFWLFSKAKNQEPPIISLWKKSAYYTNEKSAQLESFTQFLFESFYRPFVRMNLPLMVQQGIVPQIHGQNVVLALDPNSGKIESIYHRDIGSMKSDYRLRWIRGLPIDQLRSPFADKDFGLSWGAEKIQNYHLDYLHDWLLRWAYLPIIREYIPSFNPLATLPKMEQLLNEELTRLLGLQDLTGTSKEKILKYIERTPPPSLDPGPEGLQAKANSDLQLRTFLLERESLNQSVDLPSGWQKQLSANVQGALKENGYIFTDYGVIYTQHYVGKGTGNLMIAFYSQSNEPQHLGYRKAQRGVVRSCHSVHAAGF
jgi:hypothetical protein